MQLAISKMLPNVVDLKPPTQVRLITIYTATKKSANTSQTYHNQNHNNAYCRLTPFRSRRFVEFCFYVWLYFLCHVVCVLLVDMWGESILFLKVWNAGKIIFFVDRLVGKFWRIFRVGIYGVKILLIIFCNINKEFIENSSKLNS